MTPRVYFADPAASDPTDPEREADALAQWAAAAIGGEQAALRQTIRPYLAEDVELDEDDEFDDEDPDDSEVFVEVKTLKLLAAIGLPAPDAFWD